MTAKHINAALLVMLSITSIGSVPVLAQDSLWIEGQTATLQTLDKVTARIDEKAVQINQPVEFGTLTITVHHCAFRPPEEPPEHAGFLTISDKATLDDAGTRGTIVFSGWMFASSPAISGLEHAVYDVTLLSCRK